MERPTFSQRLGLKAARTVVQVGSIDDDLRAGLWNALMMSCFDCFDFRQMPATLYVCKRIWHDYLKWPVDGLKDGARIATATLKRSFFDWSWNEVYDFVEFMVRMVGEIQADEDFLKELPQDWNGANLRSNVDEVLKREMAGYRFVGDTLTPITNDEEIAALTRTLEIPLDPVREHFRKAIELLARRDNPDYANSIKESISAIEALCRRIVGSENVTLGDAIKRLRDVTPIHAALEQAWSKLYGWTSDAEGIRHAMKDEPTLDQEDALYMLISCSAFANYLVRKAEKANISLKQ